MLNVIRSKEVVVALSVVSLRTCSATNMKLSLLILWQVLLESASPTETIRSIYIVDSLSLLILKVICPIWRKVCLRLNLSGIRHMLAQWDPALLAPAPIQPDSTHLPDHRLITVIVSGKILHCQCTAPVFTLLAEAGKVWRLRLISICISHSMCAVYVYCILIHCGLQRLLVACYGPVQIWIQSLYNVVGSTVDNNFCSAKALVDCIWWVWGGETISKKKFLIQEFSGKENSRGVFFGKSWHWVIPERIDVLRKTGINHLEYGRKSGQ